MRKLVPFAVSMLVLAAGCGTEEGSESYSAALRPVGDSRSEGTARLTANKEDGTFSVRFNVTGLTPTEIHKTGIYGLRGKGAQCPGSSRQADANRNGLVEVNEGGDLFGRRLFALRPAPTVGSDGRLKVFLPYQLDSEQLDRLESLDQRVLIVLGRRANLGGRFGRDYSPNLPTACGKIAKR